MKKFSLLIVLIASLLSFSACSSNPNVGDVVCDYGTVLCDVSTSICRDIPGVPSQVCNYLDLACYNLNTLCTYRDSTESKPYQNALSNLQNITSKLREWNYSQFKTKTKNKTE